MLEDAAGIRRVVLACGTVDLRKGIDGLAMIIGDQYGQTVRPRRALIRFWRMRRGAQIRIQGIRYSMWMGTWSMSLRRKKRMFRFW